MRLWLVALLLFTAYPGSATSAGSTFELSGTILDENGLGLAGAVITLVHQATGLTRTATTSDTGRYSLPGLPPGVYSLEARLSGYATPRYAGLKYFADTKPIFNVTLLPRAVQESMTFTGEAPLLNVSQSQVGLSVEERQLEDLPLSRRDYLELATLDGSTRELGEDLQVSIDGANAHYTAYELDGFQNRRDQHGVVLADVGIDAIEELRVVSGAFEAERGGSVSGIVSAATKAGGNDWHGSVFAFFRPGGWDARDPLTSENVSLDRRNLGFTFSGPLVEEQTYFFAALEYWSQNEEVVVTAPFGGGRFRGLFELPSDGLRSLLKLSHRFDSRHQLTLKALFSQESGLEGVGGYDVFENGLDTENDDVAISGTLASSVGSAHSELRLGFVSERFRATAGPPPLGAAIRDPLAGNIGSPTRFERADEDHFEISEILSLPAGTHSLKTGFSFLRIESGSELERFVDGLIFVPSVESAPTIVWESPGTRGSLDRGESHLQAFLQDDWSISPYLTLNLGLRWEKETSVPDNDNFAPRLGLHWDATEDGRTSVRGGYGIFYSSVLSIVDTLEGLYGQSGVGVVARADGAAATSPNFYAPEKRRSPRAQQWSVGVEREWLPTLSFALDFNHIRGSDLLLPLDSNAPSFYDYTEGGSRSSAAADLTRPFGVSSFRDLYLIGSRGSSRFWGVKVQATKRYQTSFTLQAVYQWSRTTNDGDDYRIEESLPLDPARPDLEWGRSAFDIPHSFVASGVWDASFGLRFSAIARARSGRPLDPRVEADLDGDLKLRERGVASGGILERNSFRAGSVASLDVSVGKTWELGEARRLALSLDVFNVTNRLNPLQILETYGASETPLPSFLDVVQAEAPRQFQLSARFLF
jgi:TonB dependent receptor/Carboxypeptidase regulatory-like domain